MAMSDYQKEDFDFVAQIDETHFWYEGRRMVVASLMDQFVGANNECTILDVGCGDGAMTKTLMRYGKVYGFDSNFSGAELCIKKGCRTVVGNALSIPFKEGGFDLVGIFDCLEHIQNDEMVLRECRRVLKPNGRILIFVPAFQFLWNLIDVYSFHVRRYSRASLFSILRQAHLTVGYASYFMATLFPILFLSALRDKLLRRKSDRVLDWKNKLRVPPLGINRLLIWLLACEDRIRRHVGLPFGTTLIAIAKKGE